MSKIKVLQFSPHEENCGVGKYQEQFVNEVTRQTDSFEVETDFYDSSQYKTRVMNSQELDSEMGRLESTLKGYDILHIQHEFGLYSNDEFARMVEAGRSAGVKVVATVHLSPALAFKRQPREGIGLRSILHVLRQRRLHGIFIKRHIEPFRKCDLLITHNKGATDSLKSYGIASEKIFQINHPVLSRVDTDIQSDEIKKNLQVKNGDIVMSMVGYMHKYKGHEDMIRALRYLPGRYKLAIIGGMQPVSDELNIYNHLCNVIDTLDLKDRVYITGYVADDEYLNSLIRESDICVYPYNNIYYNQVSSGALNLAFANSIPVIAYPTDSFAESNECEQIVFTSAAAYYELAREIKRIDIEKQRTRTKEYAKAHSWENSSRILCDKYKSIVS